MRDLRSSLWQSFIYRSSGLLRRVVMYYEGVSKSFRTGRQEREPQMVQLSAARRSCFGLLCVSLVSFATITLRVASWRVLIFVVVSLSTQSGKFWICPRIPTFTRASLPLSWGWTASWRWKLKTSTCGPFYVITNSSYICLVLLNCTRNVQVVKHR